MAGGGVSKNIWNCFRTDWLTNWLKELLIGGVMGNLEGLFDTVNTQVGEKIHKRLP